jgi:hypothetical protein
MLRLWLVLAAVALAAVAEAFLLFGIVSHPAGAGDPSGEGFRSLLAWASLPLIASAAAAIALHKLGRVIPVKGFVGAVLAGLLIGALGLIQFSHSTPGFLVVAFLIRCTVVTVSAGRAWRHAI